MSPTSEIHLLPFVIYEVDAFAERTGHTYYWLDSVATPGDTRDRTLLRVIRRQPFARVSHNAEATRLIHG